MSIAIRSIFTFREILKVYYRREHFQHWVFNISRSELSLSISFEFHFQDYFVIIVMLAPDPLRAVLHYRIGNISRERKVGFSRWIAFPSDPTRRQSSTWNLYFFPLSWKLGSVVERERYFVFFSASKCVSGPRSFSLAFLSVYVRAVVWIKFW